jgi:hypothetical protein
MKRLALLLALVLAGPGCGPTEPSTTASPETSAVATAAPTSSTPAPNPEASAPPATSSAAAAAPKVGAPFACGGLTCEVFDTPEAAFAQVLERDKPLILALGESHAQKNDPPAKSTTARFTELFLPKLQGKASSLVLELWVTDGACGKKQEQQVAEKQKEVTKGQAESNQNEFVTLGQKSKSLDIVPFILKPTCEQYEKVRAAGDNWIFEMLSVITVNMREKAKALFAETEKKAKGKMVLLYGGAMHNDRAPKEGREGWSFAKDLDDLSGGRYVELDLIVPEFIKDNPSWRALPWFNAYDVEKMKGSTVLISTGPRSYALIFPRSGGD